MSRNRVEVLITAIDQATPVLQRLGRDISGGMLSFGFDLASKAVNGFMSAVEKASQATTDNIMAVGSLASVMGQSYEIADKLNNKITKGLAEQAAALPGSTDDYVTVYRTISDDVAGMSKELNGGKFSAQKFEGQVVKLTSKFTALKGAASIGEVTQGLQALLGGRKISQLNKLKFFRERNPVLKKNLEKLVELQGQDLNEMNGGQRLEVILKALDMTLTDDTIKRMTATFDAIKQTFLTKMFDPNIGMFGLLRDVDGNLENGMQTAFEGITKALDSVIGEKGVLTELGKLMSALGIDFGDPMVHLRDGMLGFAALMNRVAGFFRNLTSGKFSKNQIFEQLLQAPSMVGKWLAGIVNNLFKNLQGVDFGAIAGVGVQIIGSILQGIGTFFTSIDPNTLATAAGGLAIASQIFPIVGTLIAAIVGTVGLIFSGVPALLLIGAGLATASLVQTIPQLWGAITTIIGSFFNGLWISLSTEAMYWLTVVKVSISQMWAGIRSAISGWTGGTTQSIGTLFSQAVAFVQAKVGETIAWVGQAVNNLVEGIKSAILNLFNSIQSAVQNAISSIQLPSIGDIGGAAMGAASGAANMVGGAVSNVMGGAATGYMPDSGLGGLLNAAMTEARKMPSGANLMMANTSEAILNRGQQGAMAGALSGMGGAMPPSVSVGKSGGTFAPQISIHPTPGMDINALADAVMQKIDALYRQYEQGFLV